MGAWGVTPRGKGRVVECRRCEDAVAYVPGRRREPATREIQIASMRFQYHVAHSPDCDGGEIVFRRVFVCRCAKPMTVERDNEELCGRCDGHVRWAGAAGIGTVVPSQELLGLGAAIEVVPMPVPILTQEQAEAMQTPPSDEDQAPSSGGERDPRLRGIRLPELARQRNTPWA